MKTLTKVGTWLPIFSGFYETIWDGENDQENDIDEINDQRKEKGLEAIEWDDVEWNYNEYQQDVAKSFTHWIETELKKLGLVTNFTCEEIRSPREYNFSNDSVNVQVELTNSNKQKIMRYLKKNNVAFSEYLQSRYTSYDGFMSRHSNDVLDWLTNDTLTHEHRLGSVLNFILLNENDENLENDIYDRLSGDGCRVYAKNFVELTEVVP